MALDHLKSSRFWLRAAGSLVFRLACYDAMAFMALIGEARAAPTLPDAVLAHVPYVEVIARYNYLLWLLAYVPMAVALLLRDGDRFVRYMITAGLLALIRGVCILTTGLGPTRGADVHAGMSDAERWSAFVRLSTPL